MPVEVEWLVAVADDSSVVQFEFRDLHLRTMKEGKLRLFGDAGKVDRSACLKVKGRKVESPTCLTHRNVANAGKRGPSTFRLSDLRHSDTPAAV